MLPYALLLTTTASLLLYQRCEARSMNTMLLDRRLFVYPDILYTKWSDWGTCQRKECIQLRMRECKDGSYYDPIYQLTKSTVCPVRYILEERKCEDESMCHAVPGGKFVYKPFDLA